jgi:hypothetical protein
VDDARRPLVDVTAVAARLRVVVGVLSLAAIVAAIVDGLLSGLTFAVLLRWTVIFAMAVVAVAIAIVIADLLRGRRRD